MLWVVFTLVNKEAELHHAPVRSILLVRPGRAAGLEFGLQAHAAGIIFVTFLTVRLSPGAVHAFSNGRDFEVATDRIGNSL